METHTSDIAFKNNLSFPGASVGASSSAGPQQLSLLYLWDGTTDPSRASSRTLMEGRFVLLLDLKNSVNFKMCLLYAGKKTVLAPRTEMALSLGSAELNRHCHFSNSKANFE